MVEARWDPVYRVLKARMSFFRSRGQITDLGYDSQQQTDFIRFPNAERCAAIAERTLARGKERVVEEPPISTM